MRMRVLLAAVVAVGAFAMPAAGSVTRACGGLVDTDCEWWDGSGDECLVFVNPQRLGIAHGAHCVFEQGS